ncbi:OprD family outer membrane porin [Geomonas sp. RF6]|uniref:OprD family outer membrane porin n=1 Tax=Geomonas sp. RF6 TaxID=2897342 RepID=UPI001E49BD3D|nr:OprD family outer membrane porin [Geomonas sp. RF6]UFS72093.1 OprD family outer membrane porin [Geomonas sp. RF6]
MKDLFFHCAKVIRSRSITVGKASAAVAIAASLSLPALALAQDGATPPAEPTSVLEMFTKGKIFGNAKTIYFSSRNNYFSGFDQDTVSIGGNVFYKTARYHGFSLGLSGFWQQGIAHNNNLAKVDSYLHPNLLGLGEAYGQWENERFRITVGNQQLEVPFANSNDWRMVPPLYQGVTARYGDSNNSITAFGINRFKSYIDNSFTRQTTYNQKIDPFGTIGTEATDGFWGVGGARTADLDSVVLKGQAWFVDYLDYARMTYLEGQVSAKEGIVKPFAAFQFMHEDGDGKELLGKVQSEVYGLQLGVKRNSITASVGYDYITPHSDSYLNGSLVTPYAHNVSSGPFFAQPYLSSTQDLGAGSAYAIDISGAARENLFVGGRYSFMDLKPSASAKSWNQSEYLVYAIYDFGGKLKGFSISDFMALQTSPVYDNPFWQNRLTLQYNF